MNSKILVSLLFVLSFHLYAYDDLKVISSSKDAILIEYTPVITDSSKIVINNIEYLRIQVKQGVYLNESEKGAPLLSGRIINIGVPSETGNTFEILSSEYADVQGMPLPASRLVKKANFTEEVYEQGEKYFASAFNDDIVSFGKFGIIRSMPVQQFIIAPVKFNYASRTLRVYKKIVFRINIARSNVPSVTTSDKMLNGVVVNFDQAKNWCISANKSLSKTNAASTVLSSGKWYRFDVADEGIYKITKGMLASYGIDANSVDPRTIKIYNNGGKVLPEQVSAERPVDLVENSIIVVGEDDGKFDDSDYILFYGRGINFQDYDKSSGKIKSYYNNYSNHNYFWITSGGSKGKRVANKNSLNTSNRYVQNSTPGYLYHKVEKVNLALTGRYFYGEDFSQSAKTRLFSNTLDGILPNSAVYYNFSFINGDANRILLTVDENSTQLYSEYLESKNVFGNDVYSFGYEQVFTGIFRGTLPESKSILKFTYNAIDGNSKGYLNYFELSYVRDLKAYSDYILFYSKDTTSVVEYQLNGFTSTNINVFDVTDNSDIKLITQPVLQSGGEFRFQSSENSSSVSKYIAVTPNAFKTPSAGQEVANQNVRGTVQGSKLIIITSSSFVEQAKKLKTYRETSAKEKITTSIFQCDQIFNEFSGGSVDVSAIRDFIKYAYENWTIKPEFVLLFGDGNYDYKNILGNNTNFVIPWETETSLNQIDSYCSDDYYGCISGDDRFVDIAVGRVNAQTSEEANGYINKVIYYESGSDKNTWRNLVTLIADDGKTSEGDDTSMHTAPSERLYNELIPRSFAVDKIYLAAYPAVQTSSGRRKPAVNQAIIDAINAGSVLINYYGHGNTEVLAHEFVFEKSVTIPALKNSRYFFLTAATCDFGYYDDPNKQSSAELLVLKSDGGCIGALSAVRPVYGDRNEILNKDFYYNLLHSSREADNLPVALGTAYFRTKAVNSNDNDRKFHFFGDPSIRLQIPQYSVVIDSINGIACKDDTISVKALSTMRLKGSVKNGNGSDWTDFNGEGVLTVFDADRSLYLQEIDYTVDIPGGVIFNGKISITNGKFSATCVVPKDISHESKLGKVVLYFYDSKIDGVGDFAKIKFGGSDTLLADDKKGPQIDIFFDDPNMKNSELVNSNSTLIVKLNDEIGLNTTGSGVGHKMEGILNKDENNPIDFSNYFTGDLDSGGKSGKITYKFNNLEPGNYNLKVKAWDVFNNPSEATVDFTVVSGNDLEVRNVYNYPNPFKSSTTFTFQQNFSVPIDVKIKIYSVAGRLIKEIEQKNLSEKFVKIDWNGKDQDENLIANGTYLYRISVKTTDGLYSKNVNGKLAILR